VLLGPRWHDAAPVIRLLALATVFSVLTSNTHYVYWALGMPRLVAALSATGAVMIVPTTMICGHIAGYLGVAFAGVLTNAALVPVNFLLLKRYAGVSFFELWARTWRVTAAAVLMLIVLWTLFPAVDYQSASPAVIALAMKVAAGALVYVSFVLVAWLLCGKPDGPETTALRAVAAWRRGK
jgi:O-antigen/teichoic acid export membrane protein